MAIVSNTLIGKSRGSVGNATFTVWKGRNVLKEKSTNPANPRTPAQLLQRAKFSRMVAYVALLVQFLVDFWGQISFNVTQYNWLASKIMKGISGDGITLFPVLPSPIVFLSSADVESIDVELAFSAANTIQIDSIIKHTLPTSPQYYDVQWFAYDALTGRRQSAYGNLSEGVSADNLTVFEDGTAALDLFVAIYDQILLKYVYIAQLQATSVTPL